MQSKEWKTLVECWHDAGKTFPFYVDKGDDAQVEPPRKVVSYLPAEGVFEFADGMLSVGLWDNWRLAASGVPAPAPAPNTYAPCTVGGHWYTRYYDGAVRCHYCGAAKPSDEKVVVSAPCDCGSVTVGGPAHSHWCSSVRK